MQIGEKYHHQKNAQSITKRMAMIARNLENKYKIVERRKNAIVEYIGSRKVQKMVEEANGMIIELAKQKHTCNSKVMIDYIIILRYTHRCPHPNELFSLMKFHLNIHRPSFKLCAAMLTTYITGALKYAAKQGCSPSKIHFVDRARKDSQEKRKIKGQHLDILEKLLQECNLKMNKYSGRDMRVKAFKHYFEHAHFCKQVMEDVHNYTLNSFLFNQMLTLYQAYYMNEPFWEAVERRKRRKELHFDRETFALILTQCVAECRLDTGETYMNMYIRVESQLTKLEIEKRRRFQREMRSSPAALSARLSDIEKKALKWKQLCQNAMGWIKQHAITREIKTFNPFDDCAPLSWIQF